MYFDKENIPEAFKQEISKLTNDVQRELLGVVEELHNTIVHEALKNVDNEFKRYIKKLKNTKIKILEKSLFDQFFEY